MWIYANGYVLKTVVLRVGVLYSSKDILSIRRVSRRVWRFG